MKYALLIYGDQVERAKMTEADLAAEMQAYYAFGAELEKYSGHHGAGTETRAEARHISRRFSAT